MAITKKDLQYEVDKLNEKYCKRTKNELKIQQAYGGYQVVLTGKPSKKEPRKWRGIGTGVVSVTNGYPSAREALADLYKADGRGYIKNNIKAYEKR